MSDTDVSPVLISQPESREQLARLRETATVFDTIQLQVGELIETENPARRYEPEELDRAVTARLGDTPDAYGTWVYYPWSNRLVHLLPQDEFRALRESRNCNKITRDEQRRLRSTTLGIAGLSVGQATAVTLALEGLGGTLRLADFDTLSLSNLNRLRAGVHELGLNKAVLTARAIWDFDPYVHIELFEQGITDENIGRFLDGLDLVFEECDDLKMKVRLREEARRRGVPVLMETSDRGLLDIERFDREPERPIFHGLAGALRAEQLVGLSNYEKVPVVLSILGATTMSPRLAGSLVDVEVSLRTWPQLASAVALGGAINTDTARRILLDQLTASGRYFVDLEQIVTPSTATPSVPDVSVRSPNATASLSEVVVTPRTGPLSSEELETIVHFASLAPSGGNAQPWRFVYRARPGTLECLLVVERSGSFLDFERRATYLAFGALAENVRLAGALLRRELQIAPFPDGARPELVCTVQVGGRARDVSARDKALAAWVPRRATNRRLGQRRSFPAAIASDLVALAEGSRCTLALRSDAEALDAFGALHGETERMRVFHPVMHREMLEELRWSTEEAERTRDGIDVATLELTPTDLAGMAVLRRRDVVETMRSIDAGHGLRQASIKAMAGASAVGVFLAHGTSPRDYFDTGMRMQRVWLAAEAHGYALQPMSAFVYVCARLDVQADSLVQPERAAFAAARAAFRQLFPVPPGHVEAFAFRLTEADAPSARALRLPVSDLLTLRDDG